MLKLDEVRVATLTDLYALEAQSRDAFQLDVIDKALNLTLGEKRSAQSPERLLRNVLRDARRSLTRSRANARKAAAGCPMPDAAHRRVCHIAADGTEAAELVTQETPEARRLAVETLKELATFADTIGSHGRGCLHGLLQSQTAPETADQCAVSVATVERAWKALRIQATNLTIPAT